EQPADFLTIENEKVTVSEADFYAIYHAVQTGPNFHYVTGYWNSVEEYRKEMTKQSLTDTLKEKLQKARGGSTELTDVPVDRLSQVLDVLELDPADTELYFKNSPDYLVALGRVYIQRDQLAQAVEVLKKALELDADHAGAYSTLGWAYTEQKDFEAALEVLDKAITLNPKDAVAYNRKGTAYFYQGQYPEALAAYSRAIEQTPTYAAYFSRGLIHQNDTEFEKSLADFDKAIDLEPDRDEAHLKRGESLMLLDRYTEAIADFSAAIRLNRNNAQGYFERAEACRKAENFQRALYDLDTAIDIDRKNATYYLQRARLHRQLGELEQALADCSLALRQNNNLAPAYELRARIYAKQGKHLAAITDFERALVGEPPPHKRKIKKYIVQLGQALHAKEQKSDGRGPATEAEKEIATAKS
ncbi:MAG: tetratricopeptide repeat protein, partial [Chloroflexi bacterium]|nr:tetratricopeptide repeat protein [Chloroflexota bacterium]